MFSRAFSRVVRPCVGAALMLAAARAAHAQLPERPLSAANGKLLAGAELSASISTDDPSFFNYTDYDNSALRMARLRLLGEWRPHERFSLLGEVRAVSSADVEVAALFARWQPVARWNFDIQAGRVPPVIGAFARRAYGRDNPLVGVPLAYQYLMSLRPDALPATVEDLLRMRGRGWRPSFPIGSQSLGPGLPMISAFRWDTGVEAHAAVRMLDLSASITRGAPSYPVVRDTNSGLQYAGRAAIVSPAGVTVGVSASRGQWIDRSVLDLVTLAPGVGTTQTIGGLDAEVMRGHWIVRGEFLRTTFGLPVAAVPGFTTPVTAASVFGEARYRFSSRWQLAGRAERMSFSDVRTSPAASPLPWDAPVRRIELTAGYRLARTWELRAGVQRNWRTGTRTTTSTFPTFQLLYWF